MFNLGMGEITVILLLALIFLGPSKLPDLAAGLGKLIKCTVNSARFLPADVQKHRCSK